MILRLLKESCLFALDALLLNKLRACLSLLGVTIGVFTIIAILTAVDGLKRNVKASVDRFGSKTLFIAKWPMIFEDNYPWWKFVNRPPIAYNDFVKLGSRATTTIAHSAFMMVAHNKTAKYKTASVKGATVVAATFYFNKVYTLDIDQGRYFTASECSVGHPVALLGYSIAKGLFPGGGSALGKTIKLDKRNVTIIGVLKKEGVSVIHANQNDDTIILPFQFGRTLINERMDESNPEIMVRVNPTLPEAEAEAEVHGLMRSIRRLQPVQEDNFAVNKITVLVEKIESLFKVLNLGAFVIGGFSILVGGFGIANIMFVSVKERTALIGIQKSLGAKNYFILFQFLAEAVFLCIIGGLLGLLLLTIMSIGVTAATGLNLMPSLNNVLTGISIASLTGILAGIIPAYSAARLNPVEAIRS